MSRKRKHYLKQVGQTSDGKPVYAGVFKFYETHGLPLEIILISFQEKGWVPDWIDLYINAIRSGMEHERIISKLEEAISDSFGKELSDAVILRLNKTFQQQSTK